MLLLHLGICKYEGTHLDMHVDHLTKLFDSQKRCYRSFEVRLPFYWWIEVGIAKHLKKCNLEGIISIFQKLLSTEFFLLVCGFQCSEALMQPF